jgi:hypothetical protein
MDGPVQGRLGMVNVSILIKHVVGVAFAVLALSACAGPKIDANAPSFDESRYAVDLDLCRGGTAFNAALHGIGGAVVGSVIGAADGAYHGALAGDAPEGAVVGAVVGGLFGVIAGAYKPLQDQDDNIRQCLTDKGYVMRL